MYSFHGNRGPYTFSAVNGKLHYRTFSLVEHETGMYTGLSAADWSVFSSKAHSCDYWILGMMSLQCNPHHPDYLLKLQQERGSRLNYLLFQPQYKRGRYTVQGQCVALSEGNRLR